MNVNKELAAAIVGALDEEQLKEILRACGLDGLPNGTGPTKAELWSKVGPSGERLPSSQNYYIPAGSLAASVSVGGRSISITYPNVTAKNQREVAGKLADAQGIIALVRDLLATAPELAYRLRDAVAQACEVLATDQSLPSTRRERMTTRGTEASHARRRVGGVA